MIQTIIITTIITTTFATCDLQCPGDLSRSVDDACYYKVEDFTKNYGKNKKSKLYLLVGEKEEIAIVSNTKKYKKLLLETGFKSKNITSKINPEGAHNETFWSTEFLEVIQWLYNIKM